MNVMCGLSKCIELDLNANIFSGVLFGQMYLRLLMYV